MSDRPLSIPVILGTARQGRMSVHAARLVHGELGKREGVETSLIDVGALRHRLDDNGQGTGDLPSSSDSTSTANSSSSSQSGSSGGGTGVAASIAVNWVVTSNTASIGSNRTVSATSGGVSVRAVNETDAAARADGFAVNLENDNSIGAGVGLNVQDVTNSASIGTDSTVSGSSITVEATTPSGETNDWTK